MNESKDYYHELLEKLDSIEKQKAWGELIINLIESNHLISKGIESLMDSLNESSKKSMLISKWIMILSIAVSVSALFTLLQGILKLF